MQINVPPGTPEIAVDHVTMTVTAFSTTIFLGKANGQEVTTRVVAVVSPQLMKAMALMLERQVKEYEERYGGIALPNKVLHDLGFEAG